MQPAHKASRGYVVVLDGRAAGISCEFPINPKAFSINHGSNIVDHVIPGSSHPRSQWVSGNVRMINMTVHVDALTGGFHVYQGVQFKQENIDLAKTAPTDTRRENPKDPLIKVKRLIRFFQSLCLPRSFFGGSAISENASIGPPPFLFVWGNDIRLRCIMRTVKVDYLRFTDNLQTMVAKIDLEFSELPTRTRTFDEFVFNGDRDEVLPVNLGSPNIDFTNGLDIDEDVEPPSPENPTTPRDFFSLLP